MKFTLQSFYLTDKGLLFINGKRAAILSTDNRIVAHLKKFNCVVKIDHMTKDFETDLYDQTAKEIEFLSILENSKYKKYFPKVYSHGVCTINRKKFPWLVEEYVDIQYRTKLIYKASPRIDVVLKKVQSELNILDIWGTKSDKFAGDRSINWGLRKSNNRLVIYDWGFQDN